MTIRFRILLAMFIIALGISSCRKELSFSENSAFSIILSTDTITFDTVFTTLGSSTRQLMVYNNNKENIKINSIKLGNGSSSFSASMSMENPVQVSLTRKYMPVTVCLFSSK